MSCQVSAHRGWRVAEPRPSVHTPDVDRACPHCSVVRAGHIAEALSRLLSFVYHSTGTLVHHFPDRHAPCLSGLLPATSAVITPVVSVLGSSVWCQRDSPSLYLGLRFYTLSSCGGYLYIQ